MIKIHPDYSVGYNEYIGDRYKKNWDKSLENLEDNKHKGNLSYKAIRRLYTALDWMLLVSRPKTADGIRSLGQFSYKIAMLTLTLPCEQMHDDLYCKKYMLNEFLTIIRKKYNLQNYIWKAEKQKNGSIHFHLIIDKYIFYKDINKIWNKILSTQGYIEQYRKNQQAKHANGFYYDKKHSKHWNKSAQLKAYKNGINSNWCNPTGTTDIHSLKKIKNARAYLAKYITKNPEYSTAFDTAAEEYKQSNNVQSLSYNAVKEIKLKIKRIKSLDN